MARKRMQRKSKLHRLKRKFRSDIPYQAGLHYKIAPDGRLSRSRWKNSLTLAKDRWKYQSGNYKVSINASKNKQEL